MYRNLSFSRPYVRQSNIDLKTIQKEKMGPFGIIRMRREIDLKGY